MLITNFYDNKVLLDTALHHPQLFTSRHAALVSV